MHTSFSIISKFHLLSDFNRRLGFRSLFEFCGLKFPIRPRSLQDKVSCMSPLKENGQEGEYFDEYENTVSANGCDCFGLFRFKTGRPGNEYKNLLQDKEPWWDEKLKKVKEVSEFCAGPKWKNFIRKIGRYFSSKRNQHKNFQYDPQSYALNFDSGFDREDDNFAS